MSQGQVEYHSEDWCYLVGTKFEDLPTGTIWFCCLSGVHMLESPADIMLRRSDRCRKCSLPFEAKTAESVTSASAVFACWLLMIILAAKFKQLTSVLLRYFLSEWSKKETFKLAITNPTPLNLGSEFVTSKVKCNFWICIWHDLL